MGVTRTGGFARTFDEKEKDLQPEGQVDGLAADTTGIKHTGHRDVLVSDAFLDGVREAFIEVSEASSAGDETVTVEFFNVTQGVVDASFTVGGGTQRARSTDLVDSITEGDEYRIRWNVTSASATTGATFDADSATMILQRTLF